MWDLLAYGMLTYIRSGVQKEDMEVRLLCTDVSTGDGASGFVLNMDGAVIGMITDETTGTNTSAVGISGLKAAIERLSNGGGMAYVGIIGQDVTPDISEQHKIPRGVYVSDVTLEGPAYNSGIQNGDGDHGGGRRGGPDREDVPGLSGDQKPRTGCDH